MGQVAFHGVSDRQGRCNPIDPVQAFRHKLDLFLHTHVFSRFEPSEIRWVLSLSGGKDSYAMAVGLRDWYAANRIPFDVYLVTIDQWHGDASRNLQRQIPWAHVNIIDACALTAHETRYRPGDQAPCRTCADVRRAITDDFVSMLPNPKSRSKVTIVARGLHLTDTAISALWRYALGTDPTDDFMRSGKARPITQLNNTVYLAKPLYYIREYEAEQFATAERHQATCCGCPACKYPSRRDIVEESLACAIRGPMWEFQVPGILRFLAQTARSDLVDQVQHRSASGTETKHSRIPTGYFQFAASLFKGRARVRELRWNSSNATSESLDTIGARRLCERAPLRHLRTIPSPALLQDAPMSEFQLRMVGTLGPYWGAIGLTPETASKAWDAQKRIFGMEIDSLWSQVNRLLQTYYSAACPLQGDLLVQIFPSPTHINARACGSSGGFL